MNNKLKIFVITVLAVCVAIGIFPMAVGAADGAMTITSSEVSGERGETVDVVLTVTENPGFAGLRITVSAESKSGFEVVDVKNGDVMKTMTAGTNILWDNTSNSYVTGTLVTLSIKITDSAKYGKNEIKVTLRDCCNEALDDVAVNISNIVIFVEGQPSVEETTTESKPAQPEETTTMPIEPDTENGVVDTDKKEEMSSASNSAEENSTEKVEDTAETIVQKPVDTEDDEDVDTKAEDDENVDTKAEDDENSKGEAPSVTPNSPEQPNDENPSEDKPSKKGCRGMISASTILMVAVLSAAWIFRKKR